MTDAPSQIVYVLTNPVMLGLVKIARPLGWKWKTAEAAVQHGRAII